MIHKVVAASIGILLLAAIVVVLYGSISVTLQYLPWTVDSSKLGFTYRYSLAGLGGISFGISSIKLVIWPIFRNVFTREIEQEDY